MPGPAAPADPELEPVEKYVALGDSYASMGTITEGFCARSDDNYPAELASLVGAAEFIDAACQGAHVEHMAGKRETPDEVLPAQIDALDKDTDLVTMSIGGNDLDFVGILECMQSALESEDDDAARGCVTEFAPSTVETLVKLPTYLAEVYGKIHDAAPDATVVTTGYMPILSTEQHCRATEVLGEEAVVWAVALTNALNSVIETAAHQNGALFVLPQGTAWHSTCAEPAGRWGALVGTETNSYPAHPSPAGQRAMAEAVAEALASAPTKARSET